MSKRHTPPITHITTQPTGWTDAILICRKCSKQLNGGFGADGTTTLRRALRDALRTAGLRGQIALLEVACLGVCPKRAVTTIRASAPGAFHIVPAGTAVNAILPVPPPWASIDIQKGRPQLAAPSVPS